MSNMQSSNATANTPALASEYNDLREDVVVNAGDYATAGGSANAYTLSVDAVITAYSAGQVFKFKANHTNTSTATLNVNSIGAKTIKKSGSVELSADDIISGQIVVVVYDGTDMQLISETGNRYSVRQMTAGETISGATTPAPVYQDTSDNEFYLCDGNDSTKLKFVGFAISDGTDANPVSVQFTGVVSGFTGLAEGEDYYVQDTAGTIGTTQGTYPVMAGRAISENELLIINTPKLDSGVMTEVNVTTAGTTDRTITTGFKPRMVALNYFIQGRTSDTGTAIYTAQSGRAVFRGTTLVSNFVYMSGEGTASDLSVPNDIGDINMDTANATALSIGDNGTGIQTTITINSLSTTGFVIRHTASGSGSYNSRSRITWEAFE